VLRGSYPADVLEVFESVVDTDGIRPEDLNVISAPIDWLGVNYYTPEMVAGGPPGDDVIGPGMGHLKSRPLEGEHTTMGWVVRPEALTELLVRIHRDYGPIELWITENGAAYDVGPGPDGTVADDARVRYLDDHLSAALDARDQGVPLAGYIAWSFLDNFEWAEGYAQRFGIVYVDYETQARIPKQSAHWLRDLLARRGRRPTT
jgi:beta-glucosidase